MSGIQPITIEEQDRYLVKRQVTRGKTHTPARLRSRALDPGAVTRTLAAFGRPDNIEGFRFPIGTQVRTKNGQSTWTVVAHAETPSGTEPRSYKVSLGKMERIFVESVLVSADGPKLLTFCTVDLATKELVPDPEHRSAEDSAIASAVDACGEPIATSPNGIVHNPKTLAVTRARAASVQPRRSEAPQASAVTHRKNAPFASAQTVTVATEGGKNPKKIGSAAYTRFACYKPVQTVAQAIEAGVLMADIKYDAAHGFVKIT
jgi:hypothetical protein